MAKKTGLPGYSKSIRPGKRGRGQKKYLAVCNDGVYLCTSSLFLIKKGRGIWPDEALATTVAIQERCQFHHVKDVTDKSACKFDTPAIPSLNILSPSDFQMGFFILFPTPFLIATKEIIHKIFQMTKLTILFLRKLSAIVNYICKKPTNLVGMNVHASYAFTVRQSRTCCMPKGII